MMSRDEDVTAHSSFEVPDVHDRVNEAYYGEFGSEFAAITRERIHWICSRVQGANVLDVGCSQGVAAILLGREGKSVTAVDAARKSIEEASGFLGREAPRVQRNVLFVHGDFLSCELARTAFDTVIMAEVLEHLLDPQAFIEEAARKLVDKGRFIVTVPYGVNDWPDHKQTFYLVEPWRIISRWFVIEEVRLFGKWVGFISRKRDSALSGSELPSESEIVASERAFEKIERDLLSKIRALSEKVQEVKSALQRSAMVQKSTEQARDESEKALIRLSAEATAATRLIDQLQRHRDACSQNLEAERAARFEIEKNCWLSDRRAEGLESQLVQKDEAIRALSNENRLLQSQLNDLEASGNSELNATLSATTKQKDELQSRILKLEQQKKFSDARVRALETSLSFRLGRAFAQAPRSRAGFRAFPRELATIFKEASRRGVLSKVKRFGAGMFRFRNSGNKTNTALTAGVSGAKGDTKQTATGTTSRTKSQASAQTFSARSAADLLSELASAVPTSNGCRHYGKIPLKIGIVTDVYMYNFYKDVFQEVQYLSPSNYERVMKETHFDVILYVTCWRGIEDDEWRGVKFREPAAKALRAILERGRVLGSKLVFQSIEDPSNFDYFLEIAQCFDYVFTSDLECVERYKAACGHDRVFYGEYGANPQLNNPIGCRRNALNVAFFAGSWAGRYKERCEDMETMFDSILSSGGKLVIADRNFGSGGEELRYPARFRDSIVPPVEHKLLQSMHKLFRYNLNFNSIKNSPTMCAMRVYELQAMGVGILSNYARSVFNNFPEIRLVPWREDLTADFEKLECYEEYRRKMALVRNVMNNKTAFDSARQLALVAGFEVPFQEPVVCVICDQITAQVRSNFDRQLYSPRVLVTVSDIDEDWELYASSNAIGYFTWFSDSDEYEENYLSDLVNGFKYTNCRYITRSAWFDDGGLSTGPQHEYTSRVGGKARTLFAASEFSPLEFLGRAPHEAVSGVTGGYSIDPFELNYRRFLERQKGIHLARSPRLSVIVPVFNNGRFLRSKCIESLMRNEAWCDMEVLLVDDGSSDEVTLRVVESLEREHGNVRAFYFRDAGSGSASRPRNKGIDLATAPLVAFLDPDNEICPRGYDTLLALYAEAGGQRQGGVDFVSGYHVKVEERARSIGKHASKRLSIVENLRSHFLDNGKFPVIPTQPAVIARRLFQSGALRFVERSAGQDTLFGWELLCHATAGAFTDAVYLIYYAQRSGSIVNAIDSSYFEKKLVLEKAQIAMLKERGLLDAFLKKHYDKFMSDWYVPKLLSVQDQAERERCAVVLSNIASMYGRALPSEARAVIQQG
jgi:SAM-dependent methyltransferase/glycosyltransferase involved in cell wall biosynthesis